VYFCTRISKKKAPGTKTTQLIKVKVNAEKWLRLGGISISALEV
jgi:hypothetical protein